MSNWRLGLAQGRVLLVEPNPLWGEAYEHEARRLRQALGSSLIEIAHIGSTSIPNISAKPILDMMAGVERLEEALLLRRALEAIGYDYAANAGIPNDHLFGKETARTHLLHVVQYLGENWVRNLRFRDRLRADPALASAYETLKQNLAAEFSSDRAAYTAAKAQFIDQVVA